MSMSFHSEFRREISFKIVKRKQHVLKIETNPRDAPFYNRLICSYRSYKTERKPICWFSDSEQFRTQSENWPPYGLTRVMTLQPQKAFPLLTISQNYFKLLILLLFITDSNFKFLLRHMATKSKQTNVYFNKSQNVPGK